VPQTCQCLEHPLDRSERLASSQQPDTEITLHLIVADSTLNVLTGGRAAKEFGTIGRAEAGGDNGVVVGSWLREQSGKPSAGSYSVSLGFGIGRWWWYWRWCTSDTCRSVAGLVSVRSRRCRPLSPLLEDSVLLRVNESSAV